MLHPRHGRIRANALKVDEWWLLAHTAVIRTLSYGGGVPAWSTDRRRDFKYSPSSYRPRINPTSTLLTIGTYHGSTVYRSKRV
jgi:hypothetical protein